MTDAVNSTPKPLLDTLIFDGTEAFMKESRNQRLKEVLDDEQAWMSENEEAIDRAIQKFEAEQTKPEEKS